MENDLEKAERTAVDAAKAVVKTFDFAYSILGEISKSIAETSSLKVGQHNFVRLSTQDARLIRRHTKSRSYGESRIQRYLYSLLSVTGETAKSPKDRHPFILVSLANTEGRPPSICYGIIRKLEGQEKSDKDYLDCFLLWINEKLKEICGSAKKAEHGWEIEEEITGKTEASKLRAHIQFQQTKLFDITNEELLSERATMITNWFLERLGMTE
ncbi:MAG: hypothetical protein JRJ66_10610 [Deltaproteobacteria bacterium]|nr:hypothetical protein [Deltaproteobacteria bacterium]MBW2045466.1 hypothetical protein [Deltaproteobacteria bacterium]